MSQDKGATGIVLYLGIVDVYCVICSAACNEGCRCCYTLHRPLYAEVKWCEVKYFAVAYREGHDDSLADHAVDSGSNFAIHMIRR